MIDQPPRFMNFLGVEPPSWKDLGVFSRKPWEEQKLPLHLKETGTVNWDEVVSLANESSDAELVEGALLGRRIMCDSSSYVGTVATRGGTKFSRERMRQLEARNSIERLPDGETPLGFVKIWGLAEWSKDPPRARVIKHTLDVNDNPNVPLHVLRYKKQAELLDEVYAGDCSLQFDFSAFYDHFAYDASVKNFFCCEDLDGIVYRLCRLGMGQRSGCGVGQATTNVAIAIPGVTYKGNWRLTSENVVVSSIIDNVRFVGIRSKLLDVGFSFLKRCARIRITVNGLGHTWEKSDEDLRKFVESQIQTKDEFNGVAYDYVNKWVRVGEKTMNKIHSVYDVPLETWSCRSFAAMMSLLLYSSRIQRVSPGRYFHVLQWFRRMSSDLSKGFRLWDSLAAIPPSIAVELHLWVTECFRNEWVTPLTLTDYRHHVFCDASAWGFGAVHVAPSGRVRVLSVPWSAEMRSRIARKSVYSEPEAIFQIACILFKPGDSVAVSFWTDNVAARGALSKGYSGSYEVNEIATKMNKVFPLNQFQFFYVEGRINFADAPSRGMSEKATLKCLDAGQMVGIVGHPVRIGALLSV